MFDAGAALALLQYGDSAYPAGGFAFSWGVEGLLADGFLTGRDSLDELVSDHLTFRWASMDRVLLARGRVGELLNRADSLDTLLKGRALDNKAEDSRLTDIDLVKGISDFQTQQQGLEAAIKSYAQVQKLSLFSMIG